MAHTNPYQDTRLRLLGHLQQGRHSTAPLMFGVVPKAASLTQSRWRQQPALMVHPSLPPQQPLQG